MPDTTGKYFLNKNVITCWLTSLYMNHSILSQITTQTLHGLPHMELKYKILYYTSYAYIVLILKANKDLQFLFFLYTHISIMHISVHPTTIFEDFIIMRTYLCIPASW